MVVLAALAVMPGCLADAPEGRDGSTGDIAVHHVRMLAVEWKGGANVETEPYPGSDHVPPGGGYGVKPPDGTGRWEVNAYRWDPGFLAVRSGDTMVLDVFGVNGARHESEVEGHDVRFNVTRGSFSEVTFVAGPPGMYRIVCHTHAPSMEAHLLVLPAAAG